MAIKIDIKEMRTNMKLTFEEFLFVCESVINCCDEHKTMFDKSDVEINLYRDNRRTLHLDIKGQV